MSDNSRIEWTDATWNPVTGCSKVSQGCKHCYAEAMWPRFNGKQSVIVPTPADGCVPNDYMPPETITGHWTRARRFTDVQCHHDRLDHPLHWKKPRRIFVNSMSDLFHPDVPDEFIDQVFARMVFSPMHTFQILTKRPDRMLEYLRRDPMTNAVREIAERVRGLPIGDGEQMSPWPRENIWLGVSVEDQETANQRVPLLMQTRAAVRFLSMEPLLGPVDLMGWLDVENPCPCGEIACDHWELDWVIVGGESGPHARPMHPDWVRSLRDQCASAGVPFLFKQWGEWVPSKMLPKDTAMPYHRWGWISENGGDVHINHLGPFKDEFSHHELMGKVGKKASGRVLDGRVWDEFPGGAA